MPIDGFFAALGSDPRTRLLPGLLYLTEAGTLAVDGRRSRTSVPGVFPAGDFIDPIYKQAATAAGSAVLGDDTKAKALCSDLARGDTADRKKDTK